MNPKRSSSLPGGEEGDETGEGEGIVGIGDAVEIRRSFLVFVVGLFEYRPTFLFAINLERSVKRNSINSNVKRSHISVARFVVS